jgi:hypothetical protein
MKKYILFLLITLSCFAAKSQFTGTDSLRNFNNRFITNNASAAFTNLRLHNLLAGMIDYIDTALSGGSGSVSLGIDTMYITSDSVFHYKKNGVFRSFVIRGNPGAGLVTQIPFSNGFGRFNNDSNFTYDRSQGLDAGRLIVGPGAINDGGLSKINSTSDNMNALALTSYGSGLNTIIFRRAEGTTGTPLALTSGKDLWNFSGRGYTGTAFTQSRAAIYAQTSQDWTDTTNGSRLYFATTANDSSTMRTRMLIDHNGSITFNNYPNLPGTIDTSTHKPLAYRLTDGMIVPFQSWPGSGGGGGAPSLTYKYVSFGGIGGVLSPGEAAIQYDSITNKLSVDSIRSIKNIPDTVHVGLFDKDAVDSAWYFGTSITAGTAATTTAGRYSKLVSDQLRVVEMNYGHGGYMLQKPPGWPLSNSFMDLYASEIPTKLAGRKYLFFAWGENDSYHEYLYPGFGLDTFQFKNDYKTIVNFAIAAGWPKSAIKIISPFWQLTSRIPLATQQKYFIAAKWFADSSGIQFIDVYTQGKSYDKLLVTDGVHPTNVGHQFHALSIYSQLSQNLQIKSGENVVNAGITVLNKLYNLGKDTAQNGYYLGGFNPDGLSVKVPKEHFLMLDNTNVATQSGNASVLGSISAGVAIRAGGQPLFSSGSGFEMYYNGADGLLAPLNRDASTSGNIFMPFSKLVVGSSSPTSPFTQLYVVGSGYARGLYSSGTGNVLANTSASPTETTLNMLVSGDSVGHITTYNGSTYNRLSLNGTSTLPVVINTLSDNGSGAKLQVNGKISIAAHTIASNSDSAVVWNRSTKAYEYAKITGSPSYQVYTVLLTATTGNDPTATVLGTNSVGAIVWTRNSAGNYTGTLSSAFTANKTWATIQAGDMAGNFVNGFISSTTTSTITLVTLDNVNSAVDAFSNLSIEIRVYP